MQRLESRPRRAPRAPLPPEVGTCQPGARIMRVPCGPAHRLVRIDPPEAQKPHMVSVEPGDIGADAAPADQERHFPHLNAARGGISGARADLQQPSVPEDIAMEWALVVSLGAGDAASDLGDSRDDIEICAICLEPLSPEMPSIVRLPRCGHRFHLLCTPTMQLPGPSSPDSGRDLACAVCRAPFVWDEVRPNIVGPTCKGQAPETEAGGAHGSLVEEGARLQGMNEALCSQQWLDEGLLNLGPRQVGGKEGSGSSGSAAGAASASGAGRWRAARRGPRSEMIRGIFSACDADKNGRLNLTELKTFAAQTGFDGEEAAWADEYTMLCAERHRDPTEGLDAAAFMELLSDTSEAGCYCTDEELRAVFAALCTKASSAAAGQ
mmetsp:Transcript_118234/g.264042  ORF Transcript_118234/g.264042 Transcript_118234/m.264042 type:complete len:380 (-) Transcript_118234:106-1245(-)